MKTMTFRIPQFYRIGRNKETARLYKSEERLTKAMEDAARSLKELKEQELETTIDGRREIDFWTEALPDEFLSLLDTFEHGATVAACVAFLASHGFDVKPGDRCPWAVDMEQRELRRKEENHGT